MSQSIELIENTDVSQVGHMFCEDCASELNVVLCNNAGYMHPRYNQNWDLAWHEFNPIRFIYPTLIKALWDYDFSAMCPSCGNNNKYRLRVLDNSLFDIRLIQLSFKRKTNLYNCKRCEGVFVNQKCMIDIGRGNYICGDCAAFA